MMNSNVPGQDHPIQALSFCNCCHSKGLGNISGVANSELQMGGLGYFFDVGFCICGDGYHNFIL